MKKTVIDWSKYTDKDGKLKPEYELNKFGFPIKVKELYDPVPKKSKVAFKRPLSAHERVMKAIKVHERLTRLANQPGDNDFDGPDIENMAVHQLMTDPVSGQEMTAGEYHMLSIEREKAHKDVQEANRRRVEAQARNAPLKRSKAQKKAADSNLSDAETSGDADDDNADD